MTLLSASAKMTGAALGHPQKVRVTITMTLTVVVEKAQGNWGAYAPDLEDSVIATGDTREEAIQNFRDALLDLFDYKREQGRVVPDVTALEVRARSNSRHWKQEWLSPCSGRPLAPAARPEAGDAGGGEGGSAPAGGRRRTRRFLTRAGALA